MHTSKDENIQATPDLPGAESAPPGSPQPTRPRVSVILPVFNESQILATALSEVHRFADDHPDYEFLYVNDGSTDETSSVLQNEISHSRIRVAEYATNQGKGFAIRHGAKHADGDFVIMSDGDLAYSLEQLDTIVQALDHFDIVIGTRNGSTEMNRRSPLRGMLGAGFNRLVRLMFVFTWTDTQAGLKGFHRTAADVVFARSRLSRFASDVELLVIARHHNLNIGEVTVTVSPEHKSTTSTVHPIFDSLQMFLDLLRIRVNSWIGRYA